MIDLYKYISEGLLKGQDAHLAKDEASELIITEWIKGHYRGMGAYDVEKCEALDRPHSWDDLSFREEKTRDGKYIVDFAGNLDFYGVDRDDAKRLTNDMFVWGQVEGSFCYSAYNGKLETLEGAPERVGRRFTVNYSTKLKNLEGAPEWVGGGFNCNVNKSLTSLKGCPKYVGGHFAVSQCNKLKEFDYMPQHIGGGIDAVHNKSLESLKGLPSVVNGYLYINNCVNLESLKYCPVEINGNFYFENCKKVTDFIDYLPKKVAGDLKCKGCGKRYTIDEILCLCEVGGKVDAWKR
jgi:hypothetical protein